MMKLFVLVFLQISQADHAEVGEVDESFPCDLDGYVHHLLVRWVQPQAVQGHMQVLVERTYSMPRLIVCALREHQYQHDYYKRMLLHICFQQMCACLICRGEKIDSTFKKHLRQDSSSSGLSAALGKLRTP